MKDQTKAIEEVLNKHSSHINWKAGHMELIVAQLLDILEVEITKGLLNKPSKLRIGMLRQALNEDRITDPNKIVDNEYIEHWLGIKELKLKGERNGK